MAYVQSRTAAKRLGLHPNTLRKWADSGKIKHINTGSGHRRYDIDVYLGINTEPETICYCRVSSYKQKDDLTRQVDYMRERFPNAKIITDIASVIYFKRKGLKGILEQAINESMLRIVVVHKDRLCRFGYDLIEWIVKRSAGQIMVLNEFKLSPESELTKDLLTILHGFSCRMHGLRSYKNQINKAFSNQKPKADS